jgi:ABC-type nitrate/sulfonate/bicarbonate transport system substrate-binding protein
LEKGEPASFTFSRAKVKSKEDLAGRRLSVKHAGSTSPTSILTYLTRGTKVRDHTIVLTPPTMSSADGAGPVAGQIPLSAYRGD